MLEIVMPGTRYGQAKMNSSTAYRGCMCYIAGVDVDGYQLLQLPYTSAQAGRAFFPVNKIYYEEYYNDTSDSVDKITKGDMIVYYEGGEYITDKFDKASFTYLNASYWSKLEHVSSAQSHAIDVAGMSTAIAYTGLAMLNVSTGAGNGHGYLTTANPGSWVFNHHVAYAIGVYAEDSANPKLRFRIDRNIRQGVFSDTEQFVS